MKEDLKRKQVGLVQNQQKYVEEEMERRRKDGEDMGVMAQMNVMKEVMGKMKDEIIADQQNITKKHGTGFVGQTSMNWVEGIEESEDRP